MLAEDLEHLILARLCFLLNVVGHTGKFHGTIRGDLGLIEECAIRLSILNTEGLLRVLGSRAIQRGWLEELEAAIRWNQILELLELLVP